MKHKILKMHLGTWRKLRGLIPGIPNETIDDYFQRVNATITFFIKKLGGQTYE